jgi:hypothetical protein
VVNLSYDLIGFGRGAQAASSQVRVNALRLGAAAPGTDPGTDPRNALGDIHRFSHG